MLFIPNSCAIWLMPMIVLICLTMPASLPSTSSLPSLPPRPRDNNSHLLLRPPRLVTISDQLFLHRSKNVHHLGYVLDNNLIFFLNWLLFWPKYIRGYLVKSWRTGEFVRTAGGVISGSPGRCWCNTPALIAGKTAVLLQTLLGALNSQQRFGFGGHIIFFLRLAIWPTGLDNILLCFDFPCGFWFCNHQYIECWEYCSCCCCYWVFLFVTYGEFSTCF